MRLYEYEAKELLRKHGLPVPAGITTSTSSQKAEFKAPCVVKAQVLSSERIREGGIVICKDARQVDAAVASLLKLTIKGEQVKTLLLEEYIDIKKAYYIGFLFDTDSRSPILLLSSHGGTGIEQQGSVYRHAIDALKGLTLLEAELVLQETGTPATLAPVLVSLWNTFVLEDCKLLELNPLAETLTGFVCVDAHIELDDFASHRHKEWNYPERQSALGRALTSREKIVKAISEKDHHGTVKYLELDGDIAFLAAGGGGSLTCMDALMDSGGRPANYTEFSGDPTEEKMYTLTKEAITKPGIKGCWIVGAIANFSRVDTMMSGIVRAFEEVKPTFPIVVRRAGPYEKEGLAILTNAAKKHGWDLEVFGAETPLTATADIIVKKVKGAR